MFWRYLLLSFLLVVPRSQIFTTATIEVSDDDLVDRIVSQLSELSLAEDPPAAKKNDEVTEVKKEPEPEEKAPVADDENPPPLPSAPAALQQNRHGRVHGANDDDDDKKFLLIIAVASGAGFIGIVMAGVCYYKFRKSHKAATEVDYPAYGVTGPTKERIPSPGDRKLAQSAQMYHYQHQKQQMIAMEKANGDMKHDASDDDSEEDNVEGDYTVYECPGLAPTGEMEVKNPLFRGDDMTPVNPNQVDVTLSQANGHGHHPASQDEEH